jgi:hypothetical protein
VSISSSIDFRGCFENYFENEEYIDQGYHLINIKKLASSISEFVVGTFCAGVMLCDVIMLVV